MHHFDVPPGIRPWTAAPDGRTAETVTPGELITLAEAAAYARLAPVALLLAVTHRRLRPVLVDPLDGAGTLLARRDVDAWRHRRPVPGS